MSDGIATIETVSPRQSNRVIETVADDWQSRMEVVVSTVREMSLQTDPQEMVRIYGEGMRKITSNDGFVALSRRRLDPPYYRITRSSLWGPAVNPWKESHRLPVLDRGVLGDLIHADEPRIINDFVVAEDDPAYEHLSGYRSLMAIPNFDRGAALNMTVIFRKEPDAFDPDQFPEIVLRSNLFGQATHNLVLSEELKQAYEVVDHELKIVADIQRSLLPKTLPTSPKLSLAEHYQTSRHAGGDYYDVFLLPDGSIGILIADVSGHGTPAAVMMAITHSIAHSFPGPQAPPEKMLNFINQQLMQHYMSDNETFVTAFYGVIDPATRVIRFACAGHNPPRLKSCIDGTIRSLDGHCGLPLGVFDDEVYQDNVEELRPGDQIVFYTDGLTDAEAPDGSMFGLDRLDQVLIYCADDADELIQNVLGAVELFTRGYPAADDRTILVAKIS